MKSIIVRVRNGMTVWGLSRLATVAAATLTLAACGSPPPVYSYQPIPNQWEAAPRYNAAPAYIQPATTVTPPQQAYVPEQPAPKPAACNNWIFSCAGASPSRPPPAARPVEPVEADDCHGWWRVCHAWQ